MRERVSEKDKLDADEQRKYSATVVVGGDGLPLLFLLLLFWRPLLEIFCLLAYIKGREEHVLPIACDFFPILNLSQQTSRRCYFKRMYSSNNNDEKNRDSMPKRLVLVNKCRLTE